MREAGYCECQCGRFAPPGKRFVHGHNRRKPERYEVRDCGYETPCWVWQGARNGLDYGAIREGRQTRPAHRVYYERANGPVPAGMFLDHLCRNPPCVNPEHLEPVTPAENVRRGITPKITMAVANDIRARIAAGERQADIARLVDVSQQVVCDIKKGRSWVAP